MTENLLNTEDDNLPDVDPNKDYYAELVGENKKFKDNASLARSKFEADQYIEILKRRQDDLRADYLQLKEDNDSKAKLQDLINQISKERQTSSDNTPANDDQQLALDPNQIKSLVSEEMQRQRTTEKQDSNFELVRSKLQERFGKNYKTLVKQQIDELGITESELNELAKRQPKLLLRTLGLDQQVQQEQFTAPPRNQHRSDTFSPSANKQRTWSYYQDLKAKDPNAWLDRNTAIQMQKDALELGDKFKDGDYFKYGDT